MVKKETKMPLPKIYLDDDLFSTQEQRDDKLKEKVVNISLNDIDDFPKHPFKVIDNEDMKQMVESISENGVLVPTLVRPKENGKYEMISGHRRKFASELAGLETIPCIVRELTDDEATIIMVDSNLQREKILPSEKAFAYKLKMEALSHQGIRNDLTSAPLEHKFISREQIAKEKLNNKEFNNIDVLYSSNYVRTIQTAKYLAENNNIEINIMSNLGERKFGIDSWNQLPENFERKQILDENYKIGTGENQKEVRDRMYFAIIKILNENKNKRIAIVSHATAISFLIKKWCDIEIINNKLRYSFKNNILLEGHIEYCTGFKLEFAEDNHLINIEFLK